MMILYIIICVFLVITFLYMAYKEAKKWDLVMIAMIIIPLILRIFLIK